MHVCQSVSNQLVASFEESAFYTWLSRFIALGIASQATVHVPAFNEVGIDLFELCGACGAPHFHAFCLTPFVLKALVNMFKDNIVFILTGH